MAHKEKKTNHVKKGAAATTLVTLSTVALSFSGGQKAQAITATMNIYAELLRILEMTINTSLDFGVLAITEERAGEAVIDPLTDKMTVGGSGALTQAGGTPRAGKIRVKGISAPVTVSMEETSIRLTNGTTHVTVNDFNFMSGDGGPQVTVVPSQAGATATLSIGATLVTKQGQLIGSYVGSNRIFANYQ